MSRVKIKFPDDKPLFIVKIPVRITDINYGNHLGNDSVLSVMHEARMQLLHSWGYDELHAGGTALIMADVMIAYRGEAFYGDMLDINLYAVEITDISFDLLYHISTIRNGEKRDIAHAKTAMLSFDYTMRKTTIMTEALKKRIEGVEF